MFGRHVNIPISFGDPKFADTLPLASLNLEAPQYKITAF
jgi:hypothetical protein